MPLHDLLPARDSAGWAQVRIAEDARALASIARRSVNLKLLDVQYRRTAQYAIPDPTVHAVLETLARAIPTASQIWLPAAFGGGNPSDSRSAPHVDHALLRSLWSALRELGMPVSLYADAPYACRWGWPQWVARAQNGDRTTAWAARSGSEFWTRDLATAGIDPQAWAAEVHTLSEAELKRKLRALKRYRSQWRLLRQHRASLGYEVRFRLIDPSPACGPSSPAVEPLIEEVQAVKDRGGVPAP
jgi:hypothetical protein